MVDFVQEQLRVGLFVSRIMMKHKCWVKEVMDTNGEISRDIFISEEDVWNMARKFAMESHKRHVNDAKMFILDFENHDNVFFI